MTKASSANEDDVPVFEIPALHETSVNVREIQWVTQLQLPLSQNKIKQTCLLRSRMDYLRRLLPLHP